MLPSHLDNKQKPNNNHHLHRRDHRFSGRGARYFYYQDREAANSRLHLTPCVGACATCFHTPAPQTPPLLRAQHASVRESYMEHKAYCQHQQPWRCNRRHGAPCPKGTQHTGGKEQRHRPSVYTIIEIKESAAPSIDQSSFETRGGQLSRLQQHVRTTRDSSSPPPMS
ncbi:unnamed protein product, partial [Ectocarpus fasciculatus]